MEKDIFFKLIIKIFWKRLNQGESFSVFVIFLISLIKLGKASLDDIMNQVIDYPRIKPSLIVPSPGIGTFCTVLRLGILAAYYTSRGLRGQLLSYLLSP